MAMTPKKTAPKKPVKITGTATGTKTPTAAQVNAATRNGMAMSKRAGSTAAKNEKGRARSRFM